MKYFFLILFLTFPVFADLDRACSNFCQKDSAIGYTITEQNACQCLYSPDEPGTKATTLDGETFGIESPRNENELEVIDPDSD